jgi:hypothetical protein
VNLVDRGSHRDRDVHLSRRASRDQHAREEKLAHLHAAVAGYREQRIGLGGRVARDPGRRAGRPRREAAETATPAREPGYRRDALRPRAPREAGGYAHRRGRSSHDRPPPGPESSRGTAAGTKNEGDAREGEGDAEQGAAAPLGPRCRRGRPTKSMRERGRRDGSPVDAVDRDGHNVEASAVHRRGAMIASPLRRGRKFVV